MPTHSLLPFVESPEGLAQDLLISNSASVPGPGSSMTPHSTGSDKAGLHCAAGSGPLLCCMFCDQTFAHQDELGPHVLTRHPTTFFEPTVLRIEAEFRIPGERLRPKPMAAPLDDKAEVHSCIVCGQVSQDAGELETHLRKHKDYFTYCCNLCGRRFREPWFLKNHMKMHVKPGAKSRAQQELEAPASVNGVIQDPAPEPTVTVYKMCMVCGFFFPDQHSLAQHSKIHNREAEQGKARDTRDTDATTELSAEQETFLGSLNLMPRSAGSGLYFQRTSKWIPQLDPFNTYQAWQLATRGKIAVGPNTSKDTGQEASTDNEDGNSDKEELAGIWSEGQGDKVAKGEVLGRELRSQSAAESPAPARRSLMQKDKESKDRPTKCEECQRTFRTYHQLVLHSRVHKRERGGEESPTSSLEGKLSRAGSLEQADEGSEEGAEEASLADNLGSGEDGFDRSRIKSRECSYCSKTFRSSYYLTVHLRTHTGEKPFKCHYCDYAAAQKTSLKYHLERRHKNRSQAENAGGRPSPSPTDAKQERDSPDQSTLWVPSPAITSEEKFDIKVPLAQINTELEKSTAEYLLSDAEQAERPAPLNLKTEREDVKEEMYDAPLNLSLKVSVSFPIKPRNALIPVSCPWCAYETMYPEVLIIHKRLSHKEKSDTAKKPSGALKQRRHTGCPPALDGKDVSPLPMIERGFPRRTTSPPRQPQDKVPPGNLPHGPRGSPVHGVTQENQRHRPSPEPYVAQKPVRFSEPARKPAKYIVGAPDRMGGGERSCRAGAIWHTEAARMCLSTRFAALPPQMDFGESATKRLKYSVPAGREADVTERPGFRAPGDASSRLIITGRGVKAVAPPSGPETMAGALDSEWSMMNLLRPYTPNELATLYHSSPASASHAGLTNQRAGGRTVLYQHLPALPGRQRPEPPGPMFPNQR